MKPWGMIGRKRLKTVHVCFSCAWLGGALGLLLLQLVPSPVSADELYAFNACKKILDDWVIIPAAFGCLGTGVLYGAFTKWGFFQFKWVTAKWIGTVGSILFGASFLGRWVNGLEETSRLERSLAVLSCADYLTTNTLVSWFTGVQVTTLVVLVALSVFRPWGRTDSAAGVSGRWWTFGRGEPPPPRPR